MGWLMDVLNKRKQQMTLDPDEQLVINDLTARLQDREIRLPLPRDAGMMGSDSDVWPPELRGPQNQGRRAACLAKLQKLGFMET